MRRGFQDAHGAYLRVMFRRANPSAVPTEDEAGGSRERPGSPRKVSDFEKEALFQEWVRSSLGTSPEKMDDAAYATTFEAFKSHMFRSPAEDRPPNIARSAKRPPVSPREGSIPLRMTEDQATPVDARIKELYRRLVRRLHPDLRADGSAAVSGLWHEVQEAYGAGDVARMEILLALSDIETRRTVRSVTLANARGAGGIGAGVAGAGEKLARGGRRRRMEFCATWSERGSTGASGTAVKIGSRRADAAARPPDQDDCRVGAWSGRKSDGARGWLDSRSPRRHLRRSTTGA